MCILSDLLQIGSLSWRSTNTPRFFLSSVISSWWVPSLRQRFLLAIPKGMTLYFPLLNFILFPVCQHSMLSRASSNTAIPAALPALCHQQMPSAPSYLLFQGLSEKYCARAKAHTGQALVLASREVRLPGRNMGIQALSAHSSLCNPTNSLGASTAAVCLRKLHYLFHLAIFFMDLLSINLLNKLIHPS